MTQLGGGPTGKDIFEDDEMPGAGGDSKAEDEAREAAEVQCRNKSSVFSTTNNKSHSSGRI